jgi:2-oxoglutarate dehydrogenase complex dehydrogenase (E1) component-like enzyme
MTRTLSINVIKCPLTDYIFNQGVSIPFIKMTPKIMSRTQSAFSRTSTQTNEVFQRIRNANFNANFNKAPAATDRIVKVDEISAPLEAHLARISSSGQMMDSMERIERDTIMVKSLKAQDDRTSTGGSVSDLRSTENSGTSTPDPMTPVPRVEFELPRV